LSYVESYMDCYNTKMKAEMEKKNAESTDSASAKNNEEFMKNGIAFYAKVEESMDCSSACW